MTTSRWCSQGDSLTVQPSKELEVESGGGNKRGIYGVALAQRYWNIKACLSKWSWLEVGTVILPPSTLC